MTNTATDLGNDGNLSKTTAFPAPAGSVAPWRAYLNRVIARQISRITRYYDVLVQLAPRANDRGILFDAIDCAGKNVVRSLSDLRAHELAAPGRRVAVLLNGNLNHDLDIQATLLELKEHLSRFCRVVVVAYNPYYRFLYHLANTFGLREGAEPTTFVTRTDLANLAKLAGYEVVQIKPAGYIPFELGGVGNWLNSILSGLPVLRWFSLTAVVVLRPVKVETRRPSLSVVIPCRNEKGNIESALTRMPDFGAPLEIIFVEGHSSDGTWDEVQRVTEAYKSKFTIKALQQKGKGKSDAVRLGFGEASNELITILDADLTMPPELLPRFYQAYLDGLGDFVNGSRLVYPMEGEAMRFLNRLGNIFFAKALSFVLDSRIGDSLCGTKFLLRDDYARMIRWRGDFGDFDPFGDFELLFPAAMLGLGTVDIPVRYRARTYGSTNIRRFYHGMMLLRMTVIGFIKVRLGAR